MIIATIQLQEFVKIVILNSFFLSMLMSIGMLLIKRKKIKNQIFSGLFFAFALILFNFFLNEAKRTNEYPYISAICFSGWYLIGPMLYFFALFSLNKSFEFSGNFLLHIALPFLAIVTGPLFVYLYGNKHLPGFASFFANKAVLVIGILGSISFLTYLTITGIMLIKSLLWNFKNLKTQPSALASYLMFDMFLAAAIVDSLSLFMKSDLFVQIAALLFSLCVIFLFFINLVFPGFNKTISDVVEKEKQRRTYLSNIDHEKLKITIDKLLQSEEVFTDEKLNLIKLADLSGVSSHQLSEFINANYHKNFTTFINEYRIEKAKKLLIEKPEYTVLAVAFDVGFNSKSAFNAAFRKITGITPSEFKFNNQN